MTPTLEDLAAVAEVGLGENAMTLEVLGTEETD